MASGVFCFVDMNFEKEKERRSGCQGAVTLVATTATSRNGLRVLA